MTHNALANDNHLTLREIAKKLILTKITKKKKKRNCSSLFVDENCEESNFFALRKIY